jgi:adenylate cyclase
VGRDKLNNLILDVAKVSRFHALFTTVSSQVVLSDISSTNGTFVNGVPITSSVQIIPGDVVEIGPVRIMVGPSYVKVPQTGFQSNETMTDLMQRSVIVTVLVADVCGYTYLTKTLPPRDVIKMLHEWFDGTSYIIGKYGGKVDKYIGDCVMAFWGGSSDNIKLLASEATKAAKEILSETQVLSKSQHWPHGDNYPWNCRLSLNTGQVTMGAIGAHGSRDFTVLGDTVNLAFHLNTIAGKQGNDFIISDSTANYIKDSFDLKYLGEAENKSNQQEISIYTVL